MRKMMLQSAVFVLLLTLLTGLQLKAQSCCPEFRLEFPQFNCETPDCKRGTAGQPGTDALTMCQYSTNNIKVVPGITPGFTYQWTVTGGTINGNVLTSLTTPLSYIDVTWGGGSLGTITVTIYNSDSSCFKVLNRKFCLTKSPKALFVKSTGDTVCKNQSITFTNTSLGVYTNWFWNFGDGNSQNGGMSVSHSYANAGTYIVSLTVSNAKDSGNCGCSNTFYDTITVSNATGLQITSPDCKKMHCAGDTITYCASITGCSSYNWSALGGQVIGSGSCIKVVWNNLTPSVITPTVTLTIPPSCAGSCGNTATFIEKILYNGMPIQGSNIVCENAASTYTLPSLPGVFYNWSITPNTGVTIVNGTYLNTPSFALNFTTPGTYTIKCDYIDSLQKCSGSSTKTIVVRPAYSIVGPNTSCVGCNSLFTTFPGGNFTWNINTTPALNGTGPSIAQTWTTTQVGTFTVTATQIGTAFCNSPQQAIVVVAPKPVLTIAKSTNVACPGTVVKVWVNSNVTDQNITWSYPVGTQVLNIAGPYMDTIWLTYNLSGSFTVTATQLCKYNCSQTSISTTVTNPPPPTLASPKDTVCIDETVTYSVASPIPGINYIWSITNPNLGTIQSGQGTPTVTILWHGNGTNSGVLQVRHCGGFINTPITVTLPPVVSITKTGNCFSSGGYVLTANPSGQTYLWNTGATSQSITIFSPGIYTVTVNPNGGGSCPVTKSITILSDGFAYAIAPPCIVSNCNLSSFSIPLSQLVLIMPCTPTIQWFFKPVGSTIFSPIPGANSANYNATQLGCYKSVATCSNGCTITSNTICIPDDIYFCCTTPNCSSITFGIDYSYTGCNPTSFNGFYTGTGTPTGGFPIYYCYGDGTSEQVPTLNAVHQYGSAGSYTACISTKTLVWDPILLQNDTCCITNCRQVDVPVVADIVASYNCNTGILSMSDNSSYYPNSAGATYVWSISGGSYTGVLGNTPNESVTPTSSGNFVITLSVTNGWCTSVTTKTINVVIPNAAFTVNPNPTCSQGIAYFNTTPGFASYNWQFGDGAYSFSPPAGNPQHQYLNATNAPINFTATLTVTTLDGCTASATQVISVHPKPIVTVQPSPDTICRGGSVVLSANINPNGNTMCSSYNYQWKKNGTVITGATGSTYTATDFGLYSVLVSGSTPSCNCSMVSDTAVVKLFPDPVAKIETSSTVCFDPSANPWSFNLSAANFTGYTYNWSSNNGGITFSPNNSSSNMTTATGTLVNNTNFVIYLQVVDSNGCVATDSLCIYTYKFPSVSIAATGTLCAKSINTIAVLAPVINTGYTWNTGATGTNISTTIAGQYYVTAQDLLTGCTSFSNTVSINPAPSLELFPIGCDTICIDSSITIPMAQLPNVNNYFIQWYDGIKPGGTLIYSGNGAITIPGNFLSLGLHNLWTTVTYPNGCTDSSGTYNVFVKKCCSCNGSSWAFKEFTVDTGATYHPFTCTPQQETLIGCNQLTVNAAYNCSPLGCAGSVTGEVLDNLGNVITTITSFPYTYTPTPGTSGTMFIKLIGWCDGVKCDSCIKMFYYNCPLPEPPCICDTSFKFTGNPIIIIPHGGDGLVTQNGTEVAMQCNTTFPDSLFCQKNYQFYINYQNPWPSGNCTTMVVGEVILGGNVVYTQNNVTQAAPLNYTFPGAGNYCVKFKLMVNGKVCDSCVICFNVKCTVPCECKEGFTFNGKPVIAANLPHANIKFNNINCNTSLAKPLFCNTNYSFYINYNNPYQLPCVAKDSAVLIKVGNLTPLVINANTSINNPLSYTFTTQGTYCIKHYLTVNGNICDSCIVCFSVECPPLCNCDAFDFLGNPTITFVKGNIKGIPVQGIISAPCETSIAQQLQCKRQYKFFITAGAIANEVPAGCVVTVNATIYLNNVAITSLNNVSSSNPLVYTFGKEGIYCIKYQLYVNGQLCKTCTSCFFVRCCPVYYALPPIKGNLVGCVIGGTTQIYHDSAGGTFESLDTNVARVDNNGVVTAVGYGNARIVYSWIKDPCQWYVVANYSVPQLNPIPPITGITALCRIGDSVRLAVLGVSGMWSSSNSRVAAVNNPTQRLSYNFIKALSAGNATITFSALQSGCTLTAQREVIVHNLDMHPTLGPSTVCVGKSISLTNTTPVPGNVSALWQSLNIRATVTNNGIVTGRVAGPVVVRYSLNYSNTAFGSCSARADKNITVFATPALPSIGYTVRPTFVNTSSNTICSNKNFIVKGFPVGGVWSSAGSLRVSSNGVVSIVALGTGILTYTLYNTSGCGNSRTFTYDVVSCGDFAKASSIQGAAPGYAIKLYPNPAKNKVFYKVDAGIGEGTMVLTDLQGKELQKIYFRPGVNSFVTGEYASGMYIVSFKTKSGIYTEKLIIE